MTLNITATDFFCGAGGSSTGLVAAGLEVKSAANHWALAIETHNTNHPRTDHYLDDLQQVHPSRFPRTTIAWFSPECTNHSLAKGRTRKGIGQLDLWGDSKVDPSEERSRATMREVVEFSAYHCYEAVIVENVVDIRHWQFYDDWLQAMLNLGYEHRILYLNAQFFDVPQSRDRFYAVFWRKGNRAPDLDFRPPAVCPTHGLINAVQAFKKEQHWGRYGKRRQYLYRCPQCGGEVEPQFRPAADIIDWSLPSEKIGERKNPLKEKTLQRVLAGLKKFGNWPHVADLSHSHAEHNGKVHSVVAPLSTETGQQRHALVQPFIASYHGEWDAVKPLSDPLRTVTTFNHEHAMVTPPFMVILKNSHSADGKYTLPPRGLDEPLTTLVASASQHGLITPPFILAHYNNAGLKTVDESMPALTQVNHHSLVQPPFMVEFRGGMDARLLSEPMSTVTAGVISHGLVSPELMLPECRFRMLEPHELKLGMSFTDAYVVLGNKRDQVKQIGNAVCPNVAQWIAERVMESLQ